MPIGTARQALLAEQPQDDCGPNRVHAPLLQLRSVKTRCRRDELLDQMEAQRAAKRRTLEERGGDDVFATAHTDTLGTVQPRPAADATEVGATPSD